VCVILLRGRSVRDGVVAVLWLQRARHLSPALILLGEATRGESPLQRIVPPSRAR
jgi:hypothetical protein